jgi:serine protease Do
MKRIILLIALIILLLGAGISSGKFGVNWDQINKKLKEGTNTAKLLPDTKSTDKTVRVVSEESVVIEVVEKVSPSVVTIGIERTKPVIQYDPFDPFGFFNAPRQQGTETEKADIGSGFIVSSDGLIVTNKHVVSTPNAKYQVITPDNKTYEVENIYRDPANDIAIIKINTSGLTPVEMGDSDAIKVGQLVVAMGTPLGEFRGSVTKGIVSGLGRGITAGSPFEGVAEEIDNVIQTDAAINPGNSGGPLINSASQVIGINTAVASGAENIGFALPINLVKEALDNFKKTGSFDRAFLGVSYRMIDRDLAIMNELPEGAYVQEVVEGSGAANAGIKQGDIITQIDGTKLKDTALGEIINKKKIGDRVTLKIWRDGEEKEITVMLGKYNGNS